MCQDTQAVSDPQCRKDKLRLAFFWTDIKSLWEASGRAVRTEGCYMGWLKAGRICYLLIASSFKLQIDSALHAWGRCSTKIRVPLGCRYVSEWKFSLPVIHQPLFQPFQVCCSPGGHWQIHDYWLPGVLCPTLEFGPSFARHLFPSAWRRILSILSCAVNTDCREQADFCGVVSQFLHSHPVSLSLPFLQVDKVCGQPKQQEGNLSSANIVPVKEVTETQTFVMAHTSLNNKRR